MKKILTSNQMIQKIGAIVFYTNKTKIIAYSEKVTEEGEKVKLPVVKHYKSVMKRVPLLVAHVANTTERDDKLKNTSKDARRGDCVNSLISEREYINNIKSLAIDIYGIKDLNDLDSYMMDVSFPTFHDIKDNEGNVLEQGVYSHFHEAVNQ